MKVDERELIRKIFEITPSTRKGDDAVPIEAGEEFFLISVDGVSQEKDMLPGSTPEDFGWYSCSLSLSDIAACGGNPLSILISLTFGKEVSEEFVLEFLKGAEECASYFSIHLDGGDLNEGSGFVADVVSIGKVPKEEYLSRKGARPGDEIYVTGPFGDVGGAILSMLSGEEVPPEVARRAIRPLPKLREGREIAKTKEATSMIDSSDGLYESLLELSQASGVLLKVELEQVPKGEWYLRRYGEDLRPLLFGGGELELIFTAPPGFDEKYDLGFEIFKIGNVLEGSGVKILKGGKEIEVKGHGWRHFS